MNERIELLAVQAGFNIHDDVIDGQNFNHEIQKFAELIVKECAEIADIKRDNLAGSGYVTKTIGTLIKQHFGVEEC